MDERARVAKNLCNEKPDCDTKAAGLLHDLKTNLGIEGLNALQILQPLRCQRID